MFTPSQSSSEDSNLASSLKNNYIFFSALGSCKYVLLLPTESTARSAFFLVVALFHSHVSLPEEKYNLKAILRMVCFYWPGYISSKMEQAYKPL